MSKPIQPLRIWPPILLLVAMLITRLLPTLVERRDPPFFMLFAFAPALGAIGLLVWWLILSRASGRERVLGFIAVVGCILTSYVLAHISMKPMAFVINALPSGVAAFAIAMVFVSRVPNERRTWVGVLVAVVAFSFWSLVRNDGVTGDFQSSRSWRWAPTPEETFLASLNDRPQLADGNDVADQEVLAAIQNPEWPSFRGPHRDGIQPGITLNEDWATNPPQQLWRVPIGPGWGSFAVAGNRLFTQEQRGDQEWVTCYDAETGAEVWATGYESRFWESIAGAGPRATPTLANGNLFALGAEGWLHRLDPATGAIVWKVDLRKDADRSSPTWGFCASPLVVDNLVIVHAGGKDDRGVLAYDLETAELVWSAPSGDHSYSSAQLNQVAGRDQILMVSNAGVDGIDPADGTMLWRHSAPYEGYRVLQPTLLEDLSILLSTPLGEGTECFKLIVSEGDAQAETGAPAADETSAAEPEPRGESQSFTTREVWRTRSIKPSYNDLVVHHGYIYGFDHNIFACVNVETGEKQWKKGRYGNGQVLLLPESDQMLVLTEEGELVLLRTNPEQHEELAKFQAINGKTWNHPVLIGKRLYIRNSDEAAAFQLP